MRLPTALVAAGAVALASFAAVGPAEAHHHHGHPFVAGAAGFAIGALFGSALAAPRYYAPAPVYVAPAPVYVAPVGPAGAGSPEWYSYCASKYRSFDPSSGTYLGYDGERHMCQ
jgi:hypothetical protein